MELSIRVAHRPIDMCWNCWNTIIINSWIFTTNFDLHLVCFGGIVGVLWWLNAERKWFHIEWIWFSSDVLSTANDILYDIEIEYCSIRKRQHCIIQWRFLYTFTILSIWKLIACQNTALFSVQQKRKQEEQFSKKGQSFRPTLSKITH